jgi:cell wall-associated NlpC family hydrolase
MYLGNGTMVQAPHTGARVQVVATSLSAYRSEYAGARSYYAP